MEEKTAIVTGGSNGMGKAMAERFASKGANIVITGRNEERLANAKSDIQSKTDAGVLTVQMDVRDRDDVQRTVDETKNAFGQIDVLVNNAAGNFISQAENLSENGWKAVIDICLNGTWNCSQLVGKEMIAQKTGGSMLNMIATYAWTGSAGVVHSAAAKGGILALTKSLAIEWGKYGIRVNAMAPGPIENTGGAEKLFASESQVKQIKRMNPLGEVGKLDDVADAAEFLVSSQSRYVNGDCMTVDGGQWIANSRYM
ncbi:2,4-dienoyl-CoA reductase [Salicibibacter cibarius]|uniref:2,4-dienoyl-CoA reductase n=1 Tax=Salicibibacter cibarius TaxID=2743000 RepID=A0A7T6Z8Q5_9BACI|nr:2,4-dienoyl-CoA reductase [Salicibibacter cibarius]QQK78461.1 2,4-dienoyl-CoA reductase [Salicibibacter cibarius]